MNPPAKLVIIKQMRRHELCGQMAIIKQLRRHEAAQLAIINS